MAYAPLVSLLHITDQFLELNLCFFPCTREKIESLQKTVRSLMEFLDSCPPICSQRINDLIADIRDASHEAEDFLESLIATHFLLQDGSRSYQRLKRFTEISFQQIIDKLESVNIEVGKMKLLDGSGVEERRSSALAGSSRPLSIGEGNSRDKVALDNDLEMKLMEQLVWGRSKIDVVPIVGMGGIGKTTLARILFDSQTIKDTFDVRVWATISQTYNVREIVLGIFKDIGIASDPNKDARLQLYQFLRGRKYVIVLDDVWNTQAWDDFKMLFPDNDDGSRIILTTRDSKVAAYANSFGSYNEMQLLNEDSSWNLLRRETFLQNDCPPELVETGKEIARQCQGLPLVISAIGGHLKKEEQTKEHWKHVSENVSSVLKTTNDPALEILTLSYNYLPHYLKQYFLYFGSFLEDRPIDVFRIVNLWVAEGFVKPSRSSSMEEVAEEYLKDVIERNLVFVHKYDSLGKPKRCGIHDLLRDICKREAKKENFLCFLDEDMDDDLMEIRRLIIENGKKDKYNSWDGICTVRYYYADFVIWDDSDSTDAVISDDSDPLDDDIEYNGTNSTPNYKEYQRRARWATSATRSFVCHDKYASSEAIKLASGLLKVLNMRMMSTKFPRKILELVNLKYLQLGDVRKIPSSISRLRNLQTLIVRSLYIKPMTSGIWEMPQLRHLLIGGFLLPDISHVQAKETNAYVLINLQTLSEIIDFKCTREVLERIPCLKKLNIAYSRHAVRWSFHFLNNLVYLRELESLRLDFWPHNYTLHNLAFPSSLKKLVLKGSRIPWEQLNIVGVLPNLEVLKLKFRAMKGKLWETNDGEFKQLKYLLIEMSEIIEWRTEKDHFPCLRRLSLRYCSLLEAIPSEILEIDVLERIELVDCSCAAESSAKEMVGEESDIKLIISNDDIKDHSVTGGYLLDTIAQLCCDSIKQSCCNII